MKTTFAIGCVLLAVAGGPAAAETQTNNPIWHLTLKREGVPTIQPIFRAHLTAPGEEFAFFVPQGLAVLNDAGKIKFINTDGNCIMTLRVMGPVADAGELDAQHCLQRLSATHPDAVVRAEFARRVADHYANGFDLEWTADKNITQCQRTVYTRSALGFLEFTATSDRANFPAVQAHLEAVLTTFRASRNGRIEEIHISPNS